MADHCCYPPTLSLDPHRGNQAYRRVLWIVLAINAAMFFVEIGVGLAAGSAALQADALDFRGDAANYAISLSVVGWRSAIVPPQRHACLWNRFIRWRRPTLNIK
jgi:Co/Zn/Cd efflux system component